MGGITSNALAPTVSTPTGERLIVPFGTGLAAGYFTSTSQRAVPSVYPLGYAWVQVRAWDIRLGPTYEQVNALGMGGYGESSLLYLMGGDPYGAPPTLPAPLIGLQSFSLRVVVPEPSTLSIVVLGIAMLSWVKRRSRLA